MNRYLHGIHDPDGAELMADKPGWIVFTEAIGCDPKDTSGRSYHAWASRGFGVIVRLNNGYYSENSYPGTIPTPDKYDEFAVRCANFVAASDGCNIVIIGNETNMTAETPDRKGIQPADYARCYRMCRQAIHRAKPGTEVLVAGCAPWNNQSGDWLDYWHVVLANVGEECDGVSIHTYSHGSDPSLITSEEMVHGWHWHFRVYQDQLAVMPAILYALPVFISETDQDNAWADVNSGWVQAAYAEIDRWNRTSVPAIHALCLFRSQPNDKWSFADMNGVKTDFRAAVAKGYISPITPSLPIEPERPDRPVEPPGQAPTPPVPAPGPGEPERTIDPRLLARGVTFDFAHPPAGTWYWRMTKAQWLDESEADAVGPDHHILGEVLEEGREVADVSLVVTWPSGNARVTSKADQPSAIYNYDYPMSSSLNEFSIVVVDGAPSDKVYGIGMGKLGNPSIHTSTWLTFEWVQVAEPEPGPTPPEPEPIPEVRLVHPLPASVITQHWGQNAEDYLRFGMWGHNGLDLAGRPQRTPIACIARGVVAMSDFDAAYGFYVRVDHKDLDCYSMYCHLDEPGAAVGSVLPAGGTVGLLGTSGNSTGFHLHLEIRLHNADGTYREGCPMPKGRVDPQTWCILHGLKL